MLEMRLMGTQDEIEKFLNEIFFPSIWEKCEDRKIKITKNNGIYYENKRIDKCYKRRYIKMYFKNKADDSE